MKTEKQKSKRISRHPARARYIHTAITAILFILTITSTAHASTTLGSTASKTNLNLNPGQYEIIDITFFNTGETDIDLYIEQVTPIATSSSKKDLQIYIMQKENNLLIIDPYLNLPYTTPQKIPPKATTTTWIATGKDGTLYIPSKKVSLYIKAIDKATYSKSEYNLIFQARTQNQKTTTSSQTASIGQIREFPIKVKILNIIPKTPPQTQNPSSSQPNNEKETATTDNPDTTDTTTEYLQSSNSESNYINRNYISAEDHTTTDNTTYGPLEQNHTGNIKRENNDPMTQKDSSNTITGLATGTDIQDKSKYNYMTIILIILGTLILYRTIKS